MKLSEETRIKLDQIRERFNKDSSTVLTEEGRRNNPYKTGDIIQDHFQTGRILRTTIATSVTGMSYQISYVCDRLTKKLKPYKGGEVIGMYLSNVEKQIIETK